MSTEAPGIRLHIFPIGDDFADQLRRHRADLLVIPQEAFEEHAEFHFHVLFRDRFRVDVDKNHPEVEDEITLEQFSSLPYLAASSGHVRSLSEMQLDFLGVPRNTEITTGSGMAPFLLRGTRLITLVPERLAHKISEVAEIRLLEPPYPASSRSPKSWPGPTAPTPSRRIAGFATR